MIRERALRVVLVIVGLLFLIGAYPLTKWNEPDLTCEQMLGSVYATLGVFLLLALQDPSAYRNLIAFAAWSSLVHGTVMAAQVFRGLIPHVDLWRAVLPILAVGVALIVLAPAKARAVGS